MDSDDLARHSLIAAALSSPITVTLRPEVGGANVHAFFQLDRPIFACVVVPPGSEIFDPCTTIEADGLDEAGIQRAVREWVAREFPGQAAELVFRGT